MRPRFFPPIPQPKKKPILIRVTKDDDNLVSWEEYSDRGGLQRSLYKLHIKIAIRDQQQYCDEIKLLLDEAVEVGTLWGYKYVSSTPEFMHQKLNEATRIGTSQNQLDLQRTYNNPYVLYISIYPNPEKITALCQQIERVLKKTSSEKIALSAVDLPLYPHISFRQEQFNGRCERHIPSHHAKPDTLERLKDTTLKSHLYRRLYEDSNKQIQSLKRSIKGELLLIITGIILSFIPGIEIIGVIICFSGAVIVLKGTTDKQSLSSRPLLPRPLLPTRTISPPVRIELKSLPNRAPHPTCLPSSSRKNNR